MEYVHSKRSTPGRINPRKKWGLNHGKSCNEEGSLIMCTFGNFEAYAKLSLDDILVTVDDSFTDGKVHDNVGSVGGIKCITIQLYSTPVTLKKISAACHTKYSNVCLEIRLD